LIIKSNLSFVILKIIFSPCWQANIHFFSIWCRNVGCNSFVIIYLF